MNKLMYSLLLMTAFVYGGGGFSRCKGLEEEEAGVVKLRKVGPVIDQARELVVGWKEMSDLIGVATFGESVFSSLLNRQVEFACKESIDHDQTCACQGSRALTMESLLNSAVYGQAKIQLTPEDIDLSTHQLLEGLDEDSIWYNFSKAKMYVPSRLEAISNKYRSVFKAEEIALVRHARKMEKVKKDQMKSLESAVVFLACGCREKRRHRSCLQSMVYATKHQKCIKCPSCKVAVTSSLEASLHDVVFPAEDETGSCAICRKKLWKSQKKK